LTPLLVSAHVVLSDPSHRKSPQSSGGPLRVLRLVLSDLVSVREPKAIEAPKKGKAAEEPVQWEVCVSYRLQVVDVGVGGARRSCEVSVRVEGDWRPRESELAAELCRGGGWLSVAWGDGVRLYRLPPAFSEPGEAELRALLTADSPLLAGCRPLRALLLPSPGPEEGEPQLVLVPREGAWVALLALRPPALGLGWFEAARWLLSAPPCCCLLLTPEPQSCLALGLRDGSVAFLSPGPRAVLGCGGRHRGAVSGLLLLRSPQGRPEAVVSAGLDGSLCFFSLEPPPSPGPGSEGWTPGPVEAPPLRDFRQDLPLSACLALRPRPPCGFFAQFSCGALLAYEWLGGRGELRGRAALWRRDPADPLARRHLRLMTPHRVRQLAGEPQGGGEEAVLLALYGPRLLLPLQDEAGPGEVFLGAFPLEAFFPATPTSPGPSPDPFRAVPAPAPSASFKPVTRARLQALQAQDLGPASVTSGPKAPPPDPQRTLSLPLRPDQAVFKEVVACKLQRASRKARLMSSLNDLLTYI